MSGYYVLVAGSAGNARCNDAVTDSIELLAGGLFQSLGWRLAIYGVYHHLLGLYLLDHFQPRAYKLLASVVNLSVLPLLGGR